MLAIGLRTSFAQHLGDFFVCFLRLNGILKQGHHAETYLKMLRKKKKRHDVGSTVKSLRVICW